MPSNLEGGGLLGGDGTSVESQELLSWQPASWDTDNTTAPTAKRNPRWLRSWLWPFRGSPGDSDNNNSSINNNSNGGGGGGGGSIGSSTSRPLRPTAYLDGLRGFAAFIVYIHHHELWAHAASTGGDNRMFENAYGFEGNYRFATLPFVRNFFSGGHIAVATFYVISGYVLSAKPLSLIHAGELLRLLDNVASAVFRRWFRLYIPIIVTTFVYVTWWHMFGIWTSNCDHKGSLGAEWWNWYTEIKNFTFLFKEGTIWFPYNSHLWSIPLEMRGSIIVFCAALALARATNRARQWCMLGLVFYFLYIVDGYYGALFMMGMLQCELDLMAQRDDPDFPGILRRLEPYKRSLSYVFLVVSLYLAGVPSETNSLENLRANPGWHWLSYLKAQAVFDPKWFYLFYAASFLVACVPRIRWLRRFFETRFCQYLGRVSYALYLVHGPILSTLGDRVYAMTGWVPPIELHQRMLAPYANLIPIPRMGPMGLEASFLLPHILLLPVTFWAADIVTRFVDEPTVRFTNWLYKRTLRGGGGSGTPQPKPEDALRLA
ncbi:Acyltransferase 3 [Niveomyces insectorum RCEF 264]|uniref:Acyltransferase 3 n=1 Tax=Niveomyces insectorum RCEF 264 TaxID=1081102 RepID=A0A162MT01_9HYPO|nr:Acyltransferase 3 [Niveomyces insectorum RCEF 264]